MAKRESKKWYRSRTIWLNAITAGCAALEINFSLAQGWLGPHAYLSGLVLLAGVNCVLRTVTTQPVFEGKS